MKTFKKFTYRHHIHVCSIFEGFKNATNHKTSLFLLTNEIRIWDEVAFIRSETNEQCELGDPILKQYHVKHCWHVADKYGCQQALPLFGVLSQRIPWQCPGSCWWCSSRKRWSRSELFLWVGYCQAIALLLDSKVATHVTIRWGHPWCQSKVLKQTKWTHLNH